LSSVVYNNMQIMHMRACYSVCASTGTGEDFLTSTSVTLVYVEGRRKTT